MRSIWLAVILSAAAQDQFDLVLKGGRVIDPKIAQFDYSRSAF